MPCASTHRVQRNNLTTARSIAEALTHCKAIADMSKVTLAVETPSDEEEEAASSLARLASQ